MKKSKPPNDMVKVWLDKSVDDPDFLIDLIRPFPSEKLSMRGKWPPDKTDPREPTQMDLFWSMHFIREYPQKKKKDEKDFQVVTASYIGNRFRNEIEIFECEEAKQKISEHPKCPFYEFAFTGICEIDMAWYYVAANGSIFLPTTQVILLEK